MNLHQVIARIRIENIDKDSQIYSIESNILDSANIKLERDDVSSLNES